MGCSPRGEGYLALLNGAYVAISHAAMKCLGSYSFNTGVFEVRPTEYELSELGCTVPELCDLAVRLGWIRLAGQDATIRRFARVADLQQALKLAGVTPRGVKADLLAQVARHCPQWLVEFAQRRPAFLMTDKGVIELQEHRARVNPPSPALTKEGHRAVMLQYLGQHVSDAMQPDSLVLGFKVTVRDDWAHCEISARFAGAFLPDELPDLYPLDCPNESACACVFYNTVLCGDVSAEALYLERRHVARFGSSPCRPTTQGEDWPVSIPQK